MLRTRAPLSTPKGFSFDLHVLGPPLTFALSQDQTLQFDFMLGITRSFRFELFFIDRAMQLPNALHRSGAEALAPAHPRTSRVRSQRFAEGGHAFVASFPALRFSGSVTPGKRREPPPVEGPGSLGGSVSEVKGVRCFFFGCQT